MNLAIVGCGLVGRKRAAALGAHRLVACADTDLERAQQLAESYAGSTATTNIGDAIDRPDVDAVIVCTPHDALVRTALLAIQANKHVLLEKPAARNADELRPLIGAAHSHGVVVKVGFNHRFHPALQQAHHLFVDGQIGDLMYIRGRYGHGGRPGYEREWRADPRLSGGGELLDQGSHLIDLSRWFSGNFVDVSGYVTNYFWPMPVEDNAFINLRTSAGQTAWLHASWTEWKNLFSFEVFGRIGKLQIDGLGGSYGVERLTFYRMLPELGPPETTVWEFPGDDISWSDEFAHFVACVDSGTAPSGGLDDALAALEIVGDIYRGCGRDYRT